ncbi:ATP-binding protein [Paenibacillus ehimensis]|uniref:ATP-binding protein n=1 Tax=Paenibacillus ehimensis TaxID=79264 RepID=A0ABT8V8X0_9BACL|nr:ATP-binding protein [Paenibacillus ehimensis]MDO3677388.1 ATP-binding protein [Paenibacillus ehimensis]
MDKMNWLEQMTQKQPEDAQTWFWLGKEYEAAERWLDAIQAFSKGLTQARDDALRSEIVAALSQVTARLQQQGAAASAPSPSMAGDGESRSDDRPDTSGGTPTQLFPDRGPEAESSAPEREDRSEKRAEWHDELFGEPKPEEDGPDEDDADFRGVPGRQTTAFRPKVHPGLQVVAGGKEPAPERRSDVPVITFEHVAGLKDLKKTIQMKIISPFFNQGLFAKFRKKTGGGVLLYGPPGCGKTYMARATAGECRAKFITVHITDILDPYIGISERNLKEMFDKARAQRPSVMFFDEIDAIGFNRSKSSSLTRGLVDTFLHEMDGIDSDTDHLLIIGATNMPWDVDNALKRPGRFDRLVFVEPPDVEARQHIFALQMQDRYAEKLDTAKLAKATEFFSGADIANVCERAVERVLVEILETGVERPVRMRDMEEALAEVQPSTLDWLRTAKNYVKYANQGGMYNDIERYLRKHGKHI